MIPGMTRGKQSKTKKKKINSIEVESMKLEFFRKKQRKTEHPIGPL